MYYNVVVGEDEMESPFYNQLVFYFGNDKEKAMKFAELMLKISDYRISILPFNEDENENE